MQITRREYVTNLFDKVSHKYDFINHIITLRFDMLWRTRTINIMKSYHPKIILDLATGTGDLAIKAHILNPEKITGMDPSEKMLEIAKEKVSKKKLDSIIHFIKGYSENIPAPNDHFDTIIIGFGVRNFIHLDKSLQEMYRVLKPAGVVAILETSRPSKFPLKQLHTFFFTQIIPKIGKYIVKNEDAYNYFGTTVMRFPQGKDFIQKLTRTGFKNVSSHTLTFGAATIYTAQK